MRERLWQVGFILLLIAGFMLGGLVAQDNTPAKVIRSERFELVNSAGRTVGVMGVDQNDAATLCLRDRFSRNRVVVAIKPDDTVSIQCLGSGGEVLGGFPQPKSINVALEGEPSTPSKSEYTISYSANPQYAKNSYPLCPACKGRPMATVKCPGCGGSGKYEPDVFMHPSMMTEEMAGHLILASKSANALDANKRGTCEYCLGKGIFDWQCDTCRGTGHVPGVVRIGMTEAQVKEAIGEPDGVSGKVSSKTHQQIWTYQGMAEITLDNNAVSLIKYHKSKP